MKAELLPIECGLIVLGAVKMIMTNASIPAANANVFNVEQLGKSEGDASTSGDHCPR